MRENRFVSTLESAVLAFALSFGCCGCLISGFGMDISYFLPMAVCMGCAAGSCICVSLKKGWIAVLAAAAALLFLWWRGWLLSGLGAVAYHITKFYDNAYGIGTIPWNVASSGTSELSFSSVLFESSELTINAAIFDTGALTCGMCVLGGLNALCGAYAASGVRGAWLGMLPAAAEVAMCFVVTDTIPTPVFLLLVLLGLIVLLMTVSVRRRSRVQCARLSAILALPVAVFLLVLFWRIPQDAQPPELRPEKLVTAVVDWASDLFSPQDVPNPLFHVDPILDSAYSLSNLGARREDMTPVMTVKRIGDSSDTLYLRGVAYGEYDGKSWKVAQGELGGMTAIGQDGTAEDFYYGDGTGVSPNERLRIATFQREPVVYFPYGSQELYLYGRATQAGVENTQALTEYTLWHRKGENGDYLFDALPYYKLAQYTSLPDGTRSAALAILDSAGVDRWLESDGEIRYKDAADEIIEFVRNTAPYDLNAARMPDGEDDFAIWFLRDGQSGYCVHYATAATVLLRAAGIPARFVTGYMTRSEGEILVREKDAHAWVEYFWNGCWYPLDPTPPSSDEPEPSIPQQGERPTRPQHTQPSQTSEPDDTHETNPVRPADATQPKQPDGESPDLRAPLGIIAIIIVLCALIVGQWQLRLRLRCRRQHTGSTNEQAIARLRHAMLLARLTNRTLSGNLIALANKARFSQYMLTQEELACFDVFLHEALSELQTAPLPKRILLRLVFALW